MSSQVQKMNSLSGGKVVNPTTGRQIEFMKQTHKRLIQSGQMPLPFGYSIDTRGRLVKLFDPDFFITPEQYDFVAPRRSEEEKFARKIVRGALEKAVKADTMRSVLREWRARRDGDVIVVGRQYDRDLGAVHKLWKKLERAMNGLQGVYYIFLKFYRPGEETHSEFLGSTTDNIKDIKNTVFKRFLGSDGLENGMAKIVLYKEEKGADYSLNLKDGDWNCFIKVMWDKVAASNDKRKDKKLAALEELNRKYFDSGVPFSDIPIIAGVVYGNVVIVNPMEKEVYRYTYSTGKYPTYKYVIPYDGHVDAYVEGMFDVRSKKIEYVENLEKTFKAYKGWKVCQLEKTKNNIKHMKYWYNATTLFKSIEVADIDEGDHFIYTKQDALIKEFNEDHQVFFNSMYKSQDPHLFEFVEKAVHYISGDYLFEDNLEPEIGEVQPVNEDGIGFASVNFDKLKCYDMWKAYAAFQQNDYYRRYKFPATGRLEFYSTGGALETEHIISKCGFSQISNVCTSGCAANVSKILYCTRYLEEGRIYPNPVLRFFWDFGVRFGAVATAYTNFKRDMAFSEEQIDAKIYQKVIGIFDHKEEWRTAYMHVPDKAERQHLMLYSGDRIVHHDNEILKFRIAKKEMRNNCHLAAFMLGYHAINLFGKMFQVPYKDLVYIRVDCIGCKRPCEAFDLGAELGKWKIENKEGWRELNPTSFVNITHRFDYVPEIKLTPKKLSYGKINVVTGEAGSGKTSQRIKAFEGMDERLYNAVVALPNNDLKKRFKNEFGVKVSTLHKLFMINSDGHNNEGVKLGQYANAIIDESSMLPLEYMDKILAMAEKHCVNLHFLGDLNTEDLTVYQLPPVKATVFLAHPIFRSGRVRYYKQKTNYRQQSDPEFARLLNEMRGKPNWEVEQHLGGFAKAKMEDIAGMYQDGDVVISSINDYCKEVNRHLQGRETLRIKYIKTTKKTAKNETALIPRAEFDEKAMALAFATTIHLAQGATLEGRVFVIVNRMFEENMLYVALSRARRAEQIVIVRASQSKQSPRDI